MPDLLLTEREQAALRSLYACTPVPGSPLPPHEVFEMIDVLVGGDSMGVSLADDRGTLLAEVTVPRHVGAEHAEGVGDDLGPLYVGVMHWSRHPRAAEECKALSPSLADGLAIGFRNGADCVSQLWINREKRPFGDRDLAIMRLIAPALQRLLRERPTPTLPASLTVQERRVLTQVAAGLSNAEIAAALFVAPSTVRKHLENSFRKLGVSSRMGAVAAVRGSNLPDQDLRERVQRLA